MLFTCYLLGPLTTRFQLERDMYKVDFIQFKQKDKNCGNATFVILYKLIAILSLVIFDKSEHDYCASLQQPSASGREIGEKREEGL